MRLDKLDLSNYVSKSFKNNENLAFLIITILLFFVCYGLVFNSYITNHDSIYRIYDGIESTASGRFMRKPLNDLFSFGTYNPINASILLYIFMTLSSLVVISLFKIKSFFSKIVITATIFSFPLFGFFWFYGNDIWQYTFAFLCMLGAIKYVTKIGIKNKILAIIMIVLSLATYQAFISTLTAMFSLWYIAKILVEDDIDWLELITNFLILVLGALIYFVILKIILIMSGTVMTDYRGADQVDLLYIISNLPQSIKLAYTDTAQFIFARSPMFDSHFNNLWINILILSAYPVALITAIRNKYSRKSIVSLIIIFLLLPIMINSNIFIISRIIEYTQFGYLTLMLGAIIYWLQFTIANIRIIISYIIIVYIYLNIYFLNTMLFIEIEQSNQTLAIGQQIVFDLMAINDYDPGDRVQICGGIEDNPNYAPASSTKYQVSTKWLKPGADEHTLRAGRTQYMESLFKNVGYEVNIVSEIEECDDSLGYTFPVSGYIHQSTENSEDIFIIYLS